MVSNGIIAKALLHFHSGSKISTVIRFHCWKFGTLNLTGSCFLKVLNINEKFLWLIYGMYIFGSCLYFIFKKGQNSQMHLGEMNIYEAKHRPGKLNDYNISMEI